MKTPFAAVLAISLAGFATISPAADFIETDFDVGLTSGDPVDTAGLAGMVATYQNEVGISMNPNTENRDDNMKVENAEVSPEIMQALQGLTGQALIDAATRMATENPGQAAQIAAAAVRINAANNGSASFDVSIASGILTNLNGALPPETVARIMAYGTQRLPSDNVDGSLRTLRSDYLNNLPPDQMPTVATAIDTALVQNRVAFASRLTPQAFQNASRGLTQPGDTAPDTNPFFSGVTGPTNLGGFGGAGGGGSGGGTTGGGDATATPTPTPTTPTPTPTPLPPVS